MMCSPPLSKLYGFVTLSLIVVMVGACRAEAGKKPAVHRDFPPFSFEEGDTIAMIGNGLADRMQHDGWVETLMQTASQGLDLRFRNMSISGDRPNQYPRSKGFTGMDDYLRHVKADVIFCFFGYNESFGGKKKLPEYEKQLREMIKKLRGAMPNGESLPRIVLFSPIAHEDLKSPHLPDGVKNNANLALYSGAMRKVAEQHGVTYVDLFGPTQALYRTVDVPLTFNGVHLKPEGNRRLAEVMVKALLNKEAQWPDNIEVLRKAVMDKNWQWHARYRATDGNDIWGSRSRIRFVDGQSNAEVLQHELVMLDEMTANRDTRIWALASGRELKIDDANVVRPLLVKTNIGEKGGSYMHLTAKYKGPEETLQDLKIPDGFELNVFADEKRFPQLANPVQMQIDTKGRLWAASWNTYPKWEPLKEMNDALLIFPDDDGDGRADRCVEFARVHNPLGFEFWNGGVIVTCQPDILFLKDTDGDDVADVRQVLVQGIGSADTHHAANNLIYGPDGAIYWESGVFLQNNIEHPWGASLHTGASGIYRFDPRRYTITFHAGGYSPNPHGTSFDYWGYHYATDGTGGASAQILPHENGFKSQVLLKREVRPVTSSTVVSSANFPESMQGNFLLANVIGYQGVKNYKLHREGFAEKKRKFGEAWGTPDVELLRSGDGNFRPSDIEFGEDGALYVADWHNVIIGHMQHNIRDPKRDKNHGRIYRMVNKNRPLQKPVKIDGQPIMALLDNLKHPIDGVRHRTRVELSERDTVEVIAAVKSWVSQFDANKKEDAHHLLEALWVHQQHDVRNEKLLKALLKSPEPHAVMAAKTVKHHWGVADPAKHVARAPVPHEEKKVEVVIPAYMKGESAELYKLGAEVFHREAHCATCHQSDGQGLGVIYPPVDQSQWVTGSPERLIQLTLHGLWGKIEVSGKTYDPKKGVPPMTAFRSLLDDREVAAVLTYVRNSWSNKSSPVLPEQVKMVREQSKERNAFWKPEELLKQYPMKVK